MTWTRTPLLVVAAAALWLPAAAGGCASVEIVRLQPDILHTPKGTEPLAGLQATCMGFYLLTLGLPEADLDKAVNELLIKEAKKIGADKLIDLRFDVTPSHGIWFLTKLLWFRVATAWGIAVVAQPPDDEAMDGGQGQGDTATSDERRNEREGPAEPTPSSRPATPAPSSQPSKAP